MKLNCPAGSHITNILYANFGVTGGTAGAYYVDGCSASTSMKEVTKECLGKQSCRMHAVVRNFGQPCKNSVKTLAVTATCGMAGEPFWSNMTAPTLVGVADAAVQPTCPFGSAWNTTDSTCLRQLWEKLSPLELSRRMAADTRTTRLR